MITIDTPTAGLIAMLMALWLVIAIWATLVGLRRASAARAAEADVARYIALLGSDDIWALDKVALQIARLRAEPDSEFCYAQARTFQRTLADAYGAPFPSRPVEGAVIDRVVFRQHVPAGTMLFTRALYDSLGGFDEQLKEEDWDFVIRAATRTRFAPPNVR